MVQRVELPSHLIASVLTKLGELEGIDSVLKARLVCKAWKAACSDYVGPAEVEIADAALSQACSILPGLRQLVIISADLTLDLAPLSSLSQLTSLRISHEYEAEEADLLQLHFLPPSLRDLTLDSFGVDPGCFMLIKWTGLTRLVFFWAENEAADSVSLVRSLPLLKVSHP